ncbi:ABC transporter ATP-binding protein [Methylobacterium sp. J-076]|uniref:ABC transporter ATP-binding protein n=1 Tax=Methylobacterium sp. J-076 TaxID=2836655 RepID=UPI001FBBDA30|nr:ABC transporter ATP-binding protein [Methylobacterium sp. J-076]MCJ2013172.1 ABC transporter ATP-binding protein [Methylobacterium sp. J-076]
METDPLVLTWRTARRLHATATALAVVVGTPLCALTLLCLRDLIGVMLQDEATRVRFLRLAVALPEGERVLAPGMGLRPIDLELAGFLGIAACAVALAGLGWLVAALCFRAQNRTADAVRGRVIRGIIAAPAGARDDIRGLARLLSDVLSRSERLLSAGIVVPVLALVAVLQSLAFAALAAPRLVPAAAIGLAATGLADALILRRARERQELRTRTDARVEAGLTDLIRRLPAVRNHGAGALEVSRITARVAASRAKIARAEARLAYARAPAVALAAILPALAIGIALWRSGGPGHPPATPVEPAALAAAAGAFGVAAWLVGASVRLWLGRQALRPRMREIARTMTVLEGRGGGRPSPTASRPLRPFPRAGTLATREVGAFDPGTGERLARVDVAVTMPGHVAITGGRGSGARVLAAVLAGQIEPTAGAVTYDGEDFAALDPAQRAKRIAFAGGEAVLVQGSLRQNLLYGTGPSEAPDDIALIGLCRLTGLDGFVYARGLEGRLDPEADPALAAAIVAARRGMQAALAHEGAGRLVEPFDPTLYNHQASVGENILFGTPVGGAFAPARLARHPYMRAVLEAEDLVRALTEIGLTVARMTVEIFSELPNDHPLFDAYSLFPAAERGYFEDLVVRLPAAGALRRGPAGQRDRKRLIGLALRYSETRHRFGLIDAAFEERLLQARRSFARMLPSHLAGAVEFHDPARINPAASLEENLLFGRVSLGEANAEPRVRALLRRFLADEGLEAAVYRLGLDSPVDPQGGGTLSDNAVGARDRIGIELVRCLARDPDILVMAVLEARQPEDFDARLAGLRRSRAGRGLIVCLHGSALPASPDPFDAVIAVENSTVVPQVAAPVPEPALSTP